MKTLFYLAALVLVFSSCLKEQEEYGVPNSITKVLEVTHSSIKLRVIGNIYSTATMQQWGVKYGAEEPYHYQEFSEEANITGNSVSYTVTISELNDSTTYFLLPYCYHKYYTPLYSEDTIRVTTLKEIITPYSTIGETGPGGGKIFYVDGQGGGMEMSTINRFGSWVDATSDLPNCLPDFGAGENNTELINNYASIAYSAPQKCADLDEGGFDDWFLPSQDELNLIYENLVENGYYNPVSAYYITSTQSPTSSSHCMRQDLIYGATSTFYKGSNANYVAVRSF